MSVDKIANLLPYNIIYKSANLLQYMYIYSIILYFNIYNITLQAAGQSTKLWSYVGVIYYVCLIVSYCHWNNNNETFLYNTYHD